MKQFPKLFKPIKIGKMELKNRIVMPAMCSRMAGLDGSITQRLINYYVERAKGGAGLIIAEPTIIDTETGKALFSCPNLDEDRYIPGFGELAEAIHFSQTKIGTQLMHMGRQVWKTGPLKGRQPVSASKVSFRATFPPCNIWARALTLKEIEEQIEKFATAAWRAKVAGLDTVEFHGANGYLIAQFFSPFTNKRRDKYGGTVERRARFGIDIVERTRELVGLDFPLLFRISADEFIEGGLHLNDAIKIAQMLQTAGIDALNLSVGLAETYHWIMPPMAVKRGCFVHLAEKMKQAIDLPIICAGRINDPVLAENILEEKKADLIAMGRALIADPELPKKAAEGRLDDIRQCIADNECIKRTRLDFPLCCTLNPTVGKEKELKITPTKKRKHILIIGGGPAGMEAARVANLRGHQVELYEKDTKLGGQLLLAVIPPYKEEISNAIKHLIHQIKNQEIKIVLNEAVTAELIEKLNPDVVICATGAKPLIPNIPGVNGKNVYTSWDVLNEKATIGKKVVVIGGGQVGCETAEFLVEKKKKVTLLEMLPDIAIDMEPWGRVFLKERIHDKALEVFTNVRVYEVVERGVNIIDVKQNRRFIETDTVVLAVGAVADRTLYNTIKGTRKDLFLIGDCLEPRKCYEAIHEAFQIANEI